MEERGVIGPAHPRISVPATARVSAALETVVVPHTAHVQLDLSDPGVGGDVELTSHPGYLHGSDRLLLHGALE